MSALPSDSTTPAIRLTPDRLVAEQFKVHRKTLKRWTRAQGFPPPTRIGSQNFRDQAAVDAWAAKARRS
jgi:predicted DNA-binding transcriptional regulator AlpA